MANADDLIKNMTPAELEKKMKELAFKTAALQYERAEEEFAAMQAAKAQRSRNNAQRQSQLKQQHQEKLATIRECTHRQGGSPGRERKGKGHSALRVAVLPQEERMVIMCANCPLRVFEPSKRDASKRARKGETQEQAAIRVERYHNEVEDFQRLLEHAQDQLTPEAATPMHCGKTFVFVDDEGNSTNHKHPHPCDGYAQGPDNRRVA